MTGGLAVQLLANPRARNEMDEFNGFNEFNGFGEVDGFNEFNEFI